MIESNNKKTFVFVNYYTAGKKSSEHEKKNWDFWSVCFTCAMLTHV